MPQTLKFKFISLVSLSAFLVMKIVLLVTVPVEDKLTGSYLR